MMVLHISLNKHPLIFLSNEPEEKEEGAIKFYI